MGTRELGLHIRHVTNALQGAWSLFQAQGQKDKRAPKEGQM